MYAGDHNPPHFHILSPDFEIKVEIASLDTIAGDASLRDIREALEWAEDHRAELSLKWIELNEAE